MTIEIPDFCQYPGCKRRTDIYVFLEPEGIAACAQHEPWLTERVLQAENQEAADAARRH